MILMKMVLMILFLHIIIMGFSFHLRGFSCSSQQVPDLKDKFEKYDIFAL